MNIRDIWIPHFTNKDIGVINKHPWFTIKVHGEYGDILCHYGTYDPTSLCCYPIEPEFKDRFQEKWFTEVVLSTGLHIIGKGFEFGGTPSWPEKNVLLLPIQNVVCGQACGIGYCKQLDCNIGFTAKGKWMEDLDNYLLPKDFWDISWESIQTGRYVGCEFGREHPHVCTVMIDHKKEFRCSGFVYDAEKLFNWNALNYELCNTDSDSFMNE